MRRKNETRSFYKKSQDKSQELQRDARRDPLVFSAAASEGRRSVLGTLQNYYFHLEKNFLRRSLTLSFWLRRSRPSSCRTWSSCSRGSARSAGEFSASFQSSNLEYRETKTDFPVAPLLRRRHVRERDEGCAALAAHPEQVHIPQVASPSYC